MNGFLVLSRRVDESVVCGHKGELEVYVIEIRGDTVRLGFRASRDIPIHRLEVFEAIQRERGELSERQAGGGACQQP